MLRKWQIFVEDDTKITSNSVLEVLRDRKLEDIQLDTL